MMVYILEDFLFGFTAITLNSLEHYHPTSADEGSETRR